MNRVYMPGVVLHLGDCLELLRKLPNNSIDLTLTDPPYGKKADKGTHGFGASKNRRYKGGWDSVRPSKEVFDEILRVSKNVIIFGGNYFADILPPSNHWIFWDKKGDTAFKNPFADGELTYTSFTRPVKRITFKQQGFITESKDKRYHPTQKPSELIELLLTQYSKEGDIVLDCFMGSGTTGIACVRTMRKFIGAELDEGYFRISENRINTESLKEGSTTDFCIEVIQNG